MNVIVSTQHPYVAVPYDPDIAGIVSDAKRVTWEGKDMLVVKHGFEETRFLRNVGYDVPAPILTQYDWAGGTPFKVQKATAAMMTTNRRGYVLNGMGTGKTKSALWAWDFLRRQKMAKKLLVVAPLSTVNFTWGKEIFQTLPGVKLQIIYGTKKRRLQRLADPEADIYVVNHDGLNIIADEVMARDDIDTIVFDELAVYRNGQATRTKVARKVAAQAKWCWGMTGSPVPNEPTDAWAQCSVITPSTVPKYFNRFREATMTKLTQFRWIPKQDALDTVLAAMQPAVRYTLDDVVELPDLVERTIQIDMGPKQAKVYKQMHDHAQSMIDAQEITAMNAGAVLNKLLQISAGYVYTREKDVVTLDNEERLAALVDAVNSTDRKVLVFVPFVHALNGIKEKLTSEGYDVRAVSGATPKSERDTTFNLFQNTDKVRIIVAHPQCMAHGLTLTAADTIIWFAPMPNLEIFQQANARITRIGQKYKQQILMFCATKAEKKMYAKLQAKQRVQDALLDMFADGTE